MKNSKYTKRALLTSLLSVMLCAAMLVGTTFAWFTDSVTSSGNVIKSGELDVTMKWAEGTEALDAADWKDASGTPIFNYGAWEPGYTEVRHIKISNEGTLALKYEISIKATGEVSKLADVIDVYYIKNGKQITDRSQLTDQEKIGTLSDILGKPYLAEGHISGRQDEKISSDVATIALKMQESAGDEYQGLSIGSEFSIQLSATQYTEETDSFGNDYDSKAEPVTEVGTAEELADAVAEGGNILVTKDMVLPDSLAVSGDVTIIGNGTKITAPENGSRIIDTASNTEKVTITLKNLDLNAENAERCISIYSNKGGTDLILDGCTAAANKYALNIASENSNVNITVKNSTLVGWCAFQTHSAGVKASFENCTLIGNNTFGYDPNGWNNFATFVINENAADTDLSFKNCRFEANQTTGNRQYLLSVRASGAEIDLENCTFFADGSEIPDEKLGTYISVYPAAADMELIIDGERIPIK